MIVTFYKNGEYWSETFNSLKDFISKINYSLTPGMSYWLECVEECQ